MNGMTAGQPGLRRANAANADTPTTSATRRRTSMFATSTLAITTVAASILVTSGVSPAAADTVGVSKAGTITRASVDSVGSQLTGASFPPVRGGLSGDGNRVVFTNGGDGGGGGHLVPDTNGVTDAFLHDVRTGRTTMVSVNSHGQQANDASSNPSVAYDGKHVVFESVATNLGGKDTRENIDVFQRDLVTRTTTRVSVSRHGRQTNGNNFFPVVSGNGNIVAFQSDSSNLVQERHQRTRRCVRTEHPQRQDDPRVARPAQQPVHGHLPRAVDLGQRSLCAVRHDPRR